MATYLPTSGSINLNGGNSSSINYVFGAANSVTPYGNNLLAYVGKRWYQANAATGVFTAPVTMPGDFYGKGPISPVTAGSVNFTGSTSYTIPLYSVMTVINRGGGGGGGGGASNTGGGSPGGDGGSSSFAGTTYGSVGDYGRGGNGGNNGGPGGGSGSGSDGSPGGGGGGNSGYVGYPAGQGGGAGGKSSFTFYNPVPGNPAPYGPTVGSIVSISVGGGGGGGSGGPGIVYTGIPPFYYANAPGGNGGGGGGGSVNVSWS